MASENKKRKWKNAFCCKGALKCKLPWKKKRILFYTSSQRQAEKIVLPELKESE